MISFYHFRTMKSQEAKLIPFMEEMFVEAYILRHYGEGNRLGQIKSRCLWEQKIAHICDVIDRDVSNKLAGAHSNRICRSDVRARVHEFKMKYRICTDFAQLRDICTAYIDFS